MKCLKKQAVYRFQTRDKCEKDIDYFRREYEKQKKLETIITSRKLIRPKVKKWQVAISFAILPFFIATDIILPLIFNLSLALKISLPLFLIVLTAETYVRLCLILLIKYYQATAKEETRRRCKCIPSCSEYAILSFKTIFPLIRAILKIRKRLLKTCNGEEYKIDFPTKKAGEKFENDLQQFTLPTLWRK